MKLFPLITFLISALTIFGQNHNINTKESEYLTSNKKISVFNKRQLDNTLNIKNVDVTPIYKDCENKTSNLERENCLKTNLIIDSVDKFMASEAPKKARLKKGINRIRVILNIDENGKIIVKQIIGKWPKIIVTEMKKAIENSPKMIPAILNNKNIPVKYSIRIPFNVK